MVQCKTKLLADPFMDEYEYEYEYVMSYCEPTGLYLLIEWPVLLSFQKSCLLDFGE